MSGRVRTPGSIGPIRRGRQYSGVPVTTQNADSLGIGGGGGPTTTDLSVTGPGGVSNRLAMAHIVQEAGLSVLGVTGNALADLAAIVAAVDGQVLRRAGAALGFGAIDLSSAAAVANQLALASLPSIATQTILGRKIAGSGVPAALSLSDILDFISATRGTILYRGASGWAALAPAAGALVSGGVGTDPAWTAIVAGTGTLLTGTGNPQGAVASSVGSLYQDIATGQMYAKRGGASTVYGWYPMPSVGAGGKLWSEWTLGHGGTASPFATNGYGFLSGAVAGSAFLLGTSITTQSIVTSNQRLYARALSGTTNPTNMYVATGGASAANAFKLLDDDMDLVVEFLTDSDITNLRFWCGWTQSFISDTDTLDAATNGLLFRYSTPAADGGWTGYSAGGGSNSVTATVAPIAASTLYKLRIRFVRSGGTPTAYFSVNDGTEVAKTTNMPATGAAMFFTVGLTTKAAVAKAFNVRAVSAVWG